MLTPIDSFTKELTAPTRACVLAGMLQDIVDEVLDNHPQWEGDHRVLEAVDARRLSELTSQLCTGRDLCLEF